jgi:cytochrome c553
MKFKNLVLVLCLLVTASAQAQAPSALQVRSLAASCSACHGTNGQAQPGMISLAGVPQEVTAQKMRDFKAGRLPAATVMHQLAKGYTDDEINAIAAYFAAQKK